MILFIIAWRTTSMNNFILRNIAGCYQKRNPSQTFCGDNFTTKNAKKLSLMESPFNTTRDYSLQPRTLLNSITDDFIKVFWNSCAENFGKLSEKRILWIFLLTQLHEYNLQPTTGLKVALKIYSKSAEKGKDLLKF